MVGGTVCEVCEVPGRPGVLYVDVADKADGPKARVQRCAIHVEKNETSDRIEIGDAIWWQGNRAMWTPKENRKPEGSGQRCGIDYDIEIPRVGYSGVRHPLDPRKDECNAE